MDEWIRLGEGEGVGETRIVWRMQWDGRPRPPSGSVRQDHDTVDQTWEDLGPYAIKFGNSTGTFIL